MCKWPEWNDITLFDVFIVSRFYLGNCLHVRLLQLKSELDNIIWGCGSPALKRDVAKVSSDTGKQRSSCREKRSKGGQRGHFHF